MRRRCSLLWLLADGVVDRKHKHAEQETNTSDDGKNSAWPATGFGWASDGLDLCVVDNFEQCFIEVATFVRFRIEEETLGATFHDGVRV